VIAQCHYLSIATAAWFQLEVLTVAGAQNEYFQSVFLNHQSPLCFCWSAEKKRTFAQYISITKHMPQPNNFVYPLNKNSK